MILEGIACNQGTKNCKKLSANLTQKVSGNQNKGCTKVELDKYPSCFMDIGTENQAGKTGFKQLAKICEGIGAAICGST